MCQGKLQSVRYYGGQPLSKVHVIEGVTPSLLGAHGGLAMSYIKKPAARHPKLKVNSLGLTIRDYEGSMSTLCAGCGHDSVTAALVQAF